MELFVIAATLTSAAIAPAFCFWLFYRNRRKEK